MKERVSFGISGLHSDSLKACAESTFISDFEANMAHIYHRSGYAPLDWQHAIDIMLEKKGKGYHVRNLRTICLTDADFNHNNNKMGRDHMCCAEANNNLNDAFQVVMPMVHKYAQLGKQRSFLHQQLSHDWYQYKYKLFHIGNRD